MTRSWAKSGTRCQRRSAGSFSTAAAGAGGSLRDSTSSPASLKAEKYSSNVCPAAECHLQAVVLEPGLKVSFSKVRALDDKGRVWLACGEDAGVVQRMRH